MNINWLREYLQDRRHARRNLDRLGKQISFYENMVAERTITVFRQQRQIKILRLSVKKLVDETGILKEQFAPQQEELGRLRRYKKEESERLGLLNKRVRIKYGFEIDWESLSVGNLK